MRTNIFDRLSFLSLFLVVVLLPVFFLPFVNIPIETSKGLLLVVGLAVSVIFWGFARFFDGKITLPKSICLLSGGGIVLVFFLSALFSKTPPVSFFGTMFDIGTFWFIFSGFLLMLMSSILFRDPKSAKIILFGVILSSAAVLIFQAVRLFMPAILSLGILVGKTDNVLGSWNALGLFAGFSSLMFLLVIEFFSTTRREKWILKTLVILSMILIATVNFPFIWKLLGIFSLIIFVYKVSITSRENQKQNQAEDVATEPARVLSAQARDGGRKASFPVFSLVVVMVALLFFISGNFIGEIVPSRLGIQNNEVSPSFGATVEVAKSVLKKDPIWGLGPNKFEEAWASYKPATINTTQFWDVSFSYGSGLLPTFVSTTGYLGILAWLIFFILFIWSGVKSIFSGIKNNVNWETMAFFVLSLYLFVSSFFYSGGAVIFLLGLAFAGVFLGLSASSSSQGEISFSFLNDHRKSFFSILFLVLLIIVSAATSFKYIERFISVSYFRKALTASTIPVAEASIKKALALYSNDLYLRTHAEVYLVKLNSLINKGASLSDADKALLQASLDQAVNSAQLATTYNEANYLNFQALGSVYQSLASSGVKDAYPKAVEAYKIASTLNPLNPRLKLAIASASVASGKIKEAKDYANIAISLKPDYVDALIVLSQIAKSEGNNASALNYAQRALSITPLDKDLIKYTESFKNPSSSDTTSSGATLKTEDNSTKKSGN